MIKHWRVRRACQILVGVTVALEQMQSIFAFSNMCDCPFSKTDSHSEVRDAKRGVNIPKYFIDRDPHPLPVPTGCSCFEGARKVSNRWIFWYVQPPRWAHGQICCFFVPSFQSNKFILKLKLSIVQHNLQDVRLWTGERKRERGYNNGREGMLLSSRPRVTLHLEIHRRSPMFMSYVTSAKSEMVCSGNIGTL